MYSGWDKKASDMKKSITTTATTESAFFFWWSGEIHMENLGGVMSDKSYMKMSCIANLCLKSLRQFRVICLYLKYSRRQRKLLIPPQPSTEFMSVGGFTHNQSRPVIPPWGWGRPFLLFQGGARNCCFVIIVIVEGRRGGHRTTWGQVRIQVCVHPGPLDLSTSTCLSICWRQMKNSKPESFVLFNLKFVSFENFLDFFMFYFPGL